MHPTSHLLLATKLRHYMTLFVPMLLCASKTWTSTKADLNYLQAFHIRCQRRMVRVRWFYKIEVWFHKIEDADIARQTGFLHIGDFIQKCRHTPLAKSSRWTAGSSTYIPPALQGYCDGLQSFARLEEALGSSAHYLVRKEKIDREKPVLILWTQAQTDHRGGGTRRPYRAMRPSNSSRYHACW